MWKAIKASAATAVVNCKVNLLALCSVWMAQVALIYDHESLCVFYGRNRKDTTRNTVKDNFLEEAADYVTFYMTSR